MRCTIFYCCYTFRSMKFILFRQITSIIVACFDRFLKFSLVLRETLDFDNINSSSSSIFLQYRIDNEVISDDAAIRHVCSSLRFWDVLLLLTVWQIIYNYTNNTAESTSRMKCQGFSNFSTFQVQRNDERRKKGYSTNFTHLHRCKLTSGKNSSTFLGTFKFQQFSRTKFLQPTHDVRKETFAFYRRVNS